MKINRLDLKNFTVFEKNSFDFNSGINLFVGANGTGKTHILKLLYSAVAVCGTNIPFGAKLINVFRPSNMAPGRLVNRKKGSFAAEVSVTSSIDSRLKATFSNHTTQMENIKTISEKKWKKQNMSGIFIPAKEILSHSQGFNALYSEREIPFSEIYNDIIIKAKLPLSRGKLAQAQHSLLHKLKTVMKAQRIKEENDEFFYIAKNGGKIEFSLLAEGIRKLGLLWVLIQNGSLNNGSIVFWDEPEANLNPEMYAPLVEILLELSRSDVQVFIATHDYILLKLFDLMKGESDSIDYFNLFYDEDDNLNSAVVNRFDELDPNPILEAFSNVYDLQIREALS